LAVNKKSISIAVRNNSASSAPGRNRHVTRHIGARFFLGKNKFGGSS